MPPDRTILWVGVGLLAGGVLLSLLGAVMDAGIFGVSSGTLVFFGLVVLVIAAVRGSGGKQQQQQQVVVVQGDGGGAPAAGQGPPGEAVRCPSCTHLNALEATYCGQCGGQLGSKTVRRVRR